MEAPGLAGERRRVGSHQHPGVQSEVQRFTFFSPSIEPVIHLRLNRHRRRQRAQFLPRAGHTCRRVCIGHHLPFETPAASHYHPHCIVGCDGVLLPEVHQEGSRVLRGSFSAKLIPATDVPEAPYSGSGTSTNTLARCFCTGRTDCSASSHTGEYSTHRPCDSEHAHDSQRTGFDVHGLFVHGKLRLLIVVGECDDFHY